MAGSPMMMAIRLTQDKFGLAKSLLIGWAVLLLIAIPVYIFKTKRRSDERAFCRSAS